MKYKCAVIVTTYNRSHLLYDSLKSIAFQTLNHSEYLVVVADNCSDDLGFATESVCTSVTSEFPSLNLMFINNKVNGGVTYIRNKIANAVDAEFIFFGDDDYIASPSLLESALNVFKDPTVAIVTGPLIPKYESNCPKWVDKLWVYHSMGKYLSDFTLIDFGAQEGCISSDFAFWSNWAIRKNIFIKTAGFGPDGFSKDLIIYNGNGEHHVNRYVERLGCKIVYCPSMYATHRIYPYRFRIDYFRARYQYYGIGCSFEAVRALGRPMNRLELGWYLLIQLRGLIVDLFVQPWVIKLRKLWELQGFLFHHDELMVNPFLMEYTLMDSWKDFDYTSLVKIPNSKFSLW